MVGWLVGYNFLKFTSQLHHTFLKVTTEHLSLSWTFPLWTSAFFWRRWIIFSLCRWGTFFWCGAYLYNTKPLSFCPFNPVFSFCRSVTHAARIRRIASSFELIRCRVSLWLNSFLTPEVPRLGPSNLRSVTLTMQHGPHLHNIVYMLYVYNVDAYEKHTLSIQVYINKTKEMIK